jgi:HD-GYP domain-containing protein (c-di-GMP phosphodiesterase class II)
VNRWTGAARIFYWLQVALAASLAAVALLVAPLDVRVSQAWIGPLLFVAGNLAANFFPIKLRDLEFTVSGIVVIGAIILFPAPAALAVAVPPLLVSDLVERKEWYRTLLNAAQKTSAVVLAAAVFKSIETGNALALDNLNDVAAISALFATYYVFNVVPLMLTLALVQRRRFLYVLHANLQSIYLDFVGTFLFALLPAFVYQKEPRLLPILAGVGVLVHQVFELANRLRRETEAALQVLVDIVDARDPYTHDHSLLVAEYSRKVAEMMVSNPNEIEAIVSASQLHDIGKIGVSDTILLKDDSLTPEEKRLMELHPEIGRRILEKYSQFRAGAEIVFAHQEHYDGSGYPRGLRGDEIPLGARIIAVVDAYVAMRTDRPYRRAMSAGEALEQLRSGIGTQFDPVVCANFIKLLIDSDQITQDQVVQMAELRDRREQAAR